MFSTLGLYYPQPARKAFHIGTHGFPMCNGYIVYMGTHPKIQKNIEQFL